MSVNWKYWGDALLNNKASILAFGGLLVTSAVKTMPLPGATWDLGAVYTWGYDFFHQFLNITNTRLSAAVIPTPPEAAPANPTQAVKAA